MAERLYTDEVITTVAKHPNWGAIWAGMFTFITIWSIFGVLGMAIFATAANPAAPLPVVGMSTGMDVWAVILTIIAMFVAGVVTGKLAEIGNPRDGVVHGIIMFGLSVVAVLLILGLGEGALVAGTTAGAMPLTSHSSYILNTFASIGWVGFVALFLGWFSPMAGASAGTKRRAAEVSQSGIRHAA
jgi:hypothetical protein